MPEALTGPGLQVLDRLVGRGAVEPSCQRFSAQEAEDLDIDDVRCRVVLVSGQALPD